MLESGKPHFYQTFIESAMKALAIFSEIPWVMPVLTLRKVICDSLPVYVMLTASVMRLTVPAVSHSGPLFQE